MRKLKNEFLLGLWMLFIGFTLQSCTHYYYGPNSNNVPLLQKKGDGRILAAIASAEESTGFELQSAYALGNHFGAMFNFYTAKGKNETTSGYPERTVTTIQKGNGTYGEIGGGYFSLLNNSAHWVFETYAQAGAGTVENEYLQMEKSKVKVVKLSVQPSIGYTNKAGTFQAAISSRLNNVNLSLKESNVTLDNNLYDFNEIQDLKNNSNDIYWEPSLILRGGFKNVRLQLQLTKSHAFKKKEFFTQTSVFSFGVFFSFNGQVKK